jgi:hypothetical protein
MINLAIFTARALAALTVAAVLLACMLSYFDVLVQS